MCCCFINHQTRMTVLSRVLTGRTNCITERMKYDSSTDIFHRPCQENITKMPLVQLWHGTYLMDPLLDQTAGVDIKKLDETWQPWELLIYNQVSGYICKNTTVSFECVCGVFEGEWMHCFFNILQKCWIFACVVTKIELNACPLDDCHKVSIPTFGLV